MPEAGVFKMLGNWWSILPANEVKNGKSKTKVLEGGNIVKNCNKQLIFSTFYMIRKCTKLEEDVSADGCVDQYNMWGTIKVFH